MEGSESNIAKSLAESPMAYLGLRRRLPDGQESDPPSMSNNNPGIMLNSRGIPARKRKKNSLIYGTDDMVSLPIKSPKKKQLPSSIGRRKPESPTKFPVARSLPSSPAKRPRTALKNGKKSFSATKARSEQKRQMRRQKTAIKFRHLPVRRKLLVDDEDDDDEDDIFGNDDSSDGGDSFQNDLSDLVNAFKSGLSDEDYDENEFDKPSGSKTVTPSKGRHQSGQSPSFKRLLAKRFGPSIESTDDTPESELTTPEKQSAASIGVALGNLLKLPKAHKWVCFEFFYSNLDKVLFEGENDFLVCLKESFPDLKTRLMSRVEWSKIRRMMGKPRRCSAQFFSEERAELMRKRQKIRLLQQRKQTDVASFKDLPDDIPLQVTIGARVTARLRDPRDGLFTGTVDAYDTSNNTYRIRFDRGALSTYSIPDEEVQSVEEPEMMPLSSFTARPRARVAPQVVTPFISPLRFGSTYSPQLANDPLLSGNTPRGKVMRMDGQVGGYPTKFLEQIVRLNKSLKLKKECINTLRYLNGEGERKKSFGELITEDFQRRYASTVIDLSNIDRDLNEHIKNIQEFTQQFAPEAGPTISLPNIIREGCQEDAYDIVSKNNSMEDKELVENPKVLALISSFTALMLQVKQLAEGERNSFELQALHDAMSELKSSLFSSNMSKFENNVEVHMQHIVSGLSRLGNLHAFMMSSQAPKSKELILKTEPA